MHTATESARFDAATGTVVVECSTPDGGKIEVQIGTDAAEAIVGAFNDAKPEPPLGLEDTGVYRVKDAEIIVAEDKMLLDLWVEGGRRARFIFPPS